jgi:hypothetical protein
MSIHDFRTKLEADPEGSALFAALRRLSRLDNPQFLFDTVSEGWPSWDPADGSIG